MIPDTREIYAILDLLKERDSKIADTGSIADVLLIREHPSDEFIVTAATFFYKDGSHAELALAHGSDDIGTYPEKYQDKPNHPEYIHCRDYRLTKVSLTHFRDKHTPEKTYLIDLEYDKLGLLMRTNLEVI